MVNANEAGHGVYPYRHNLDRHKRPLELPLPHRAVSALPQLAEQPRRAPALLKDIVLLRHAAVQAAIL